MLKRVAKAHNQINIWVTVHLWLALMFGTCSTSVSKLLGICIRKEDILLNGQTRGNAAEEREAYLFIAAHKTSFLRRRRIVHWNSSKTTTIWQQKHRLDLGQILPQIPPASIHARPQTKGETLIYKIGQPHGWDFRLLSWTIFEIAK